MGEKQLRPSSSRISSFAAMNEDILRNILSRLPAKSFASAACVDKSWNKVCRSILSRPGIVSACSIHPSTGNAVQEVIDRVLSKPIRPHFAIANVNRRFFSNRTLRSLVKALGSQIPIILSSVLGVIGRDALTDELREGKFWNEEDVDSNGNICSCDQSGILLTVGFLPGIKVDVIPFLRRKKNGSEGPSIDQFVMDIRDYTTSVSGCTSPIGIIMFGNEVINQRPIIEKLDYAMSMKTVIVGVERSRFLYRSVDDFRNACGNPAFSCDAVALVFASDRDKSHVAGEIHFHIALSNGISAIGPRHKAVSVRSNDSDDSTWLTARREGQQEILDGQQILDQIDALENRNHSFELYIGVTKQRKCSVGSEKSRPITSLAFHGVAGGDQEYLYVDGLGIKTGDYFQFYQPDQSAALAACHNASESIRNLKPDSCAGTSCAANHVDRKEVLGAFVFSCCGRLTSLSRTLSIDCAPFLESFPDAPLAGIFCTGEIGCGDLSTTYQESKEESLPHCGLHVYSTVYLVMTYSDVPLE